MNQTKGYEEKYQKLNDELIASVGMGIDEFLSYTGLFEVIKTLPCTLYVTPEDHYAVEKGIYLAKGVFVKFADSQRKKVLEPWGYTNQIFIEIHNLAIIGLEPIDVDLYLFLKSVAVKK